jgi:hypothetical protein
MMFAERASSGALMTKHINKLVDIVRAVKRMDVKHFRDILGKRWPANKKDFSFRGSFADNWMEASFGWRPLVNDIYGAAEAIANAHYRRPMTKARGKGTQNDKFEWPIGDYGISAKVEGEYEAIAICELYFTTSESALAALRQTGLTNPAFLAWDAFPYSFVADWIYPLGNYLNLLDATLGMEFLSGYVTAKTKMSARTVVVNEGDYPGVGSFGCKEEAFYMSREVFTTFPLPVLPSFRPPSGFFQAASSLAIFHQLMSKSH